MGEIIIRYMNLPASVKAYTLTDPNDDYNIYVNSALNSIEQQKAVDHELEHINADHFTADLSVAEVEQQVSGSPAPPSEQPLPKKYINGRQVHPVFYELRIKSGLTQYQLARKAGISPGTYAAYEACIRTVYPPHEQAIMKVLEKYI